MDEAVASEWHVPNGFTDLASVFRSRSPVLWGKAAADRLACLLRRAHIRPPAREDWLRIVGEVSAALAQFESAGWLQRPASYHTDPPAARPTRVSRKALGYAYEQLEFDSEYEPHAGEPGRERWLSYQPCRRAHAWMIRQPREQRPWLVCIPGYGMGMPWVDQVAFQVPWLVQRMKLNVLIPVLPLHGPRRIARVSGDGFFAGDCLDTLHAETQAVWDVRRMIRWLRQESGEAIGVYGISLGGYTAALLAGLEDELNCVLAGVPCSDFITLAKLHNPPALLREAETLGLDWQRLAQLYRVISPLAMEPRIGWRGRHLIAGSLDSIVPADQVELLWQHWERPHTVWYEGSHLSFTWEPAVRACIRSSLRTHLCPPARRGSARPHGTRPGADDHC